MSRQTEIIAFTLRDQIERLSGIVPLTTVTDIGLSYKAIHEAR